MPQVARGEQSTIEFRNLTWPSPFIVDISGDGTAEWRTGIDGGGSGYQCPKSAEHYCLMLEGAWKLAIPRSLISEPRIGATWTFDGTDFELVEIVRLRGNSEQSLVIKSVAPSEEVTFNFSDTDGIQAISYFIPVGDDLSVFEPSVWINTSMFDNDD